MNNDWDYSTSLRGPGWVGMNTVTSGKHLHIPLQSAAHTEDDSEWQTLSKLIHEVQLRYAYESQQSLPEHLVDCVVLDSKQLTRRNMGLVGCLVGIVEYRDTTLWKIVTHAGIILLDSLLDPARFQAVKIYRPE